MLKIIPLILCICLLVLPALAQSQPPSPLLTSHVGMLNELSPRRQVSVLFPNEQSVFKGLQKSFVNVGSGQVTFARRDLVTKGRLPLLITRIYDSSLAENSDFGVGWQLSLNETIEVLADGSLHYRDDTGTLNTLIPTTVGFKLSPAQNSDIKSVTYNTQGLLQITSIDGWTKLFQKLDDKYRLISICDNNKNNIELHYQNNQLSEVVGANRQKVTIERNTLGKIIRVIDNNNRSASYHYNQKSLLVAVDDLAGNQWQYKYHGNGLLHKVIDPLDQIAGQFDFGKDQKTTSVKVRARQHRFSYKDNTTTVKDENNKAAVFVQNAAGITTKVVNSMGFISRIVLNARHQITELWHKEPGHDEKRQAQIIYDDNGRPSRYDINGKATQMEHDLQQFTYRYDDAGRILAIEGDEKTLASYAYDARGNIILHNTPKMNRTYQYAINGDVTSESESFPGLAANTTNYTYSEDGLLTSLKAKGETSRFDYNTLGKLSKVTFPDGASHSYLYDKLGFRKNTQRSDKSSIDYVYDPVGNLKESIKRADSTVGNNNKSNKLGVNAGNQVTDIINEGQTPIHVKYTKKGNPKTISQGDSTTVYEYDDLGRLIGLTDSKKGEANYAYQKDEEDIRLQFDTRTKSVKSPQTRVTGHNQTQAQLHYARMSGSPWQSIIWNASQSKLLVSTPGQISAPDAGFQSAKQRRRLFNAKSRVKSQQRQFDKPSSAHFLVPEYNLMNCGIGGDTGNPNDGGGPLTCFLYGILLDSPGTITVGKPFTISALAVADDWCDPVYGLLVDNITMGYSNSGYFSYTFSTPGTHTVQVNAECVRCSTPFRWDGMSVEVGCPNTLAGSCVEGVGLGAKPLLTLLDDYTIQANVQPANAAVSNYKFEIRRSSEQTWHTLYSGTSPRFSSYAKVAGVFKWRVTIRSNDKDYTSPERPLEVMFPEYSDIVADSNVQAKAYAVWQNIVTSTTPTERGEQGFWIKVNTKTKQYEFSNVILGDRVGNNVQRPDIDLGSRPADSASNPTPVQTLVYTIASFHGHTPQHYLFYGRPVGPSIDDGTEDQKDNVAGIVMDYWESSSGSGRIPGYHDKNDTPKYYSSTITDGPFRRSTP